MALILERVFWAILMNLQNNLRSHRMTTVAFSLREHATILTGLKPFYLNVLCIQGLSYSFSAFITIETRTFRLCF